MENLNNYIYYFAKNCNLIYVILMKILIEGWRGINHSYALVNQWQMIELLKSTKLFFQDSPYISEKWNKEENFSGFNDEISNMIDNIPKPNIGDKHDITYRISAPLNFDNNFDSKILFVFGTCEFKYLEKTSYKNNSPEFLKTNKNFFIHTPSHWSKQGFLNAGFDDEQIIVVPHGIDKNIFKKISNDRKKSTKIKYGLHEDDYVLSNIGAMTKNKGVEILIAAYGILKKKKKNLKLILKDQSNLYEITTEYLFEKIKKTDLQKKYNVINEAMMKDIIIISKNLTLNEIRDIYSVTDCYVSPYLAEGFNLTPLEAAACGSQIVVTKGGATDDYFNKCLGYQIESNEKKINNSYLLEPKIDSLINILESIINKNDNFKNYRSEYIHKNFSWEKVVFKLKKEFENKLNLLN